LDVNLSGVFYLMQEAGRIMRSQGGGVVLNIGSLAEQAQAIKGQAAYIASNNGLIGLTQSAADEFAAYNIRVNMLRTGLQGRSINPEMVLYLCSPSADHINGQIISV